MTRSIKRDRRRQSPNGKRLAAGSIRIIAGQWRGRKLPVLNAEGLRPTTDRTKETVFNWLMHEVVDARCLDAFAGSGGLGLEALSRHAAHTTFIEMDASAAKQLRSNLVTLKCEASKAKVIEQDASAALNQLQEPYDIIFIDPPFGKGLAVPILQQIESQQLLKPNGRLYVETERTLALDPQSFGYQVLKQKSTDQVVYQLWRKSS